VSERTREFGLRMALGARANDVWKMVFGHATGIVGIGVAFGLVAAFSFSHVLEASLFQVTRTDPATYVSVSLLLIAIAFVACMIPARRATTVNPIIALRHE
jgi:putative ABC transport system permease protein